MAAACLPAAPRPRRHRAASAADGPARRPSPSSQRSPALVCSFTDSMLAKSRGRELRDSTISMPRSAGDVARVDDRHRGRQHRPEQAGDGRAHDQLAVRADERAVVADAERVRASVGELRGERARAVRRAAGTAAARAMSSVEMAGKLTALRTDAVQQEVADGRRRLDADLFLRFVRRRGDVRRGDDLRQLRQPPVGRRLLFEHVEAGAGDVSLGRSRPRAPPRRSARRARCSQSGHRAGTCAAASALKSSRVSGGRRQHGG